jgi:AraC-like DNA-binding protein
MPINGKNTVFERLADKFRLRVSHANHVQSRELFRCANRIPENRLFLVYADSTPEGGCVSVEGRSDAGATLPLRPGTVCFMPGGLALAFEFRPGLKMVGFHFSLSLGEGPDLLDAQRNLRFQQIPGERLEAIRQALAHTEQCKRLLIARGLLLTFIAEFLELSVPDMHRRLAYHERYAPMFACLEKHANASTTVGDLAETMHMSTSTLVRALKRDLGAAPKRLLIQHLVRRACESLLLGDRTIAEIADALGFTKPFYFSRFFRQHTGQNPTAYRASLRPPASPNDCTKNA